LSEYFSLNTGSCDTAGALRIPLRRFSAINTAHRCEEYKHWANNTNIKQRLTAEDLQKQNKFFSSHFSPEVEKCGPALIASLR
jgi:hypothetical protein